MARILVVDDESSVIDLLSYNLQLDGHEVTAAANGEAALALFHKSSFDLIVLDIMLPQTQGFDVCREIRKHSQVPVIFLTARQDEVDRIVGLELGADDYVLKPFSPKELRARVRAVLRRSQDVPHSVTEVIIHGNLQIDPVGHTVLIKGQPLELTRKEYELLETLVRNRGMILTRRVLLDRIWGHSFATDTRTVDIHILRLRRKIRSMDETDYIETIRGLGYRIR